MVKKIYQDFKEADSALRTALLKLNHAWVKVEIQLEVLRDIWEELHSSLQVLQQQLLAVLSVQLQSTLAKVENFVSRDRSSLNFLDKTRYLWAKSSINASVGELVEWQKTFDPTWFLIARMSSTNLDTSVSHRASEGQNPALAVKTLRTGADTSKKSVRDTASVDGRRESRIQYSSTRFFQSVDPIIFKVVDHVSIEADQDAQALIRDVQILSNVLTNVEPATFSLLTCSGLNIEGPANSPSGYELVFDVPSGLNHPRSLRVLLGTQHHHYAFQDRLAVAKSLARSVMFLHTAKFVHKNIRPEIIILFHDGQSSVGVPFLTGFEKARPADGVTQRKGNRKWEHNLYRRPQRQGASPEEDYKMQHDIYSLGVCLLEIGLWTSFVHYQSPDLEATSSSALPGTFLQTLSVGKRPTPHAIKDHLVALARQWLPSQIGQRYKDVVVSCLTCLDPNNEEFGDERSLNDRDEISVGVRYVEKVLTRLDKITV